MPLGFNLESIDPRELGRLMELLASSDVEECELQQGETRLVVKREPRGNVGAARTAAPEAGSAEPAVDSPSMVLSPAVGVFYRSEKQGQPLKVNPGDVVNSGDPLGYIEVLTVPHAVPSTGYGVVEDFLVEDGEPVEYGQPIVSLRSREAE